MIFALDNAALALFVERYVGYPEYFQRLIGHPVQWVGFLINLLDIQVNRPEAPPIENRVRGALAMVGVLMPVLLLSGLIAWLLSFVWGGWIMEALIATTLIAQKSLRDHVAAVADALDRSLADGRAAVSRIVGRDTAQLDESAVARGALESLAENASDGVIAPVFWYALGGLPGIALYKAVNTADSMIGHRSERYLHYGWAAAWLDDLVNLPCSRLAGVLFAAAASHRFGDVLRATYRDARNHVSPNAGWPEAAFATALGVTLGGPRRYGGRLLDLATMGEGRSELSRDDIRRGLSLYDRSLSLLFLAMLALAIAV